MKVYLRNSPDALAAALAWAVQGTALWLEAGLGDCPAVETATVKYFSAQNPIKKFVDACCSLNPIACVPVTEFRAAFDAWAHDEIDEQLSNVRFNLAVEELGLRRGQKKIAGIVKKIWQGIGLVDFSHQNESESGYNYDVTDDPEIDLDNL